SAWSRTPNRPWRPSRRSTTASRRPERDQCDRRHFDARHPTPKETAMPFTLRTTMSRAAAVTLLALLTVSVPLPASAANPPEQATPLALTAIMRDLGKDM